MSCEHKFITDLTLDNLDFQPEVLIVGTFNPSWPLSNTATWFYGRTRNARGNVNNNFWDVLPRLYGEQSLINADRKAWQAFCRNHKIAITDLITCINDADDANPEHQKHLKSYSDTAIAKEFKKFVKTDIVALLRKYPTIKHVYLTRGILDPFWKELWQGVIEYAGKNGITATTLLTPSRYAFYQQGIYNKLNPRAPLALNDFVLLKWKEKFGHL